ncbi:carbohydrate ABC transporter permease [uncultured Amnibacterium sp.]|uniref:carbohydrate ABC transporter permease n=1 Tax=uncultured Amnibacterium sp. TaxID=1631851 RepID=UPI0035CA6432
MPVTRLVQPVAALLLSLAFIGTPVWLVLVTSAKPLGETQVPSLALPQHLAAGANYATAFVDGSMILGLVNSLLVVIPSAVVILVLGSMASWIFARRTGRLVSWAYAVVIVGLLIPPAVVTLVLELRGLGIANTQLGLIATYVSMYLPFAVFLITGFIRALPPELEEAARVDGAGPIRVFFQIVLPLIRPVIATATIMIVLFTWSDLFYAAFVLGGGDKATLPLNLLNIASANLYQNSWNLVFAYVVLMSLPMVLVFIVAQRRIVSGVTSGALK